MDMESSNNTVEDLRAGARGYACGKFIHSLDSLYRSDIYTTLVYDRLQRKYKRVEELLTESQMNWNQTFYLMYFRTLGDSKNQEAYLTLARRAPYSIVLRERANLKRVEALLFGCSGLLNLYKNDMYTQDLKREFEYLSQKYSLEPMSPMMWDLSGIRPANHPTLRMAQAATFFTVNEFVMDRAMSCCSTKDVKNLFGAEASSYWSDHSTPAISTTYLPKRIGSFKANIIGINLVSIMQYAYGSFTQNDDLRDNAITLLENLDPEQNIYMKGWALHNLYPKSAFESQALIQLATEHCKPQLCSECRVGRRILKRGL